MKLKKRQLKLLKLRINTDLNNKDKLRQLQVDKAEVLAQQMVIQDLMLVQVQEMDLAEAQEVLAEMVLY